VGAGPPTYTDPVSAAHPGQSLPGQHLTLGPRAVLVPVKAFGEAKRRLHQAMTGPERAELARAMADRVLAAAHPLPLAVVCDDVDVAEWARAWGALVVWEPGRGLNGAVEAGVAHLGHAGVVQVTVAHADLPHATDLARVGEAAGITLVPDRHGNGTNVIAVPADAGFQFSYGPGSFSRHRAEAERLGLPWQVLHRPDLAHDVDEPGDIVPVATSRPSSL
jgi:2-phospho-L-lactate guanylyltransferase